MSKAKGSRAERKCMRMLEREGFLCTKAGGSLGLFDVIALGPNHIRAVQVKAGTARLSREDRDAIARLELAPNVTREYWRFPDYARHPLIEVIP